MTLCEEKGYRVGDIFSVERVGGSPYPKYSIIKLIEDDGSNTPLFERLDGEDTRGERFYCHLDSLGRLAMNVTITA